MRKKLFMLLALVMTVMTASAYDLTVGTNEHGTIKFKVGGSEVTSANEGQVVTVEITPATGWVVNQPSGQWYAAVAKARALSTQSASIDLLNGIELTAVQRTAEPVDLHHGACQRGDQLHLQEAADQHRHHHRQHRRPDLQPAGAGANRHPKDAGSTMTKNTDYSVAYSNNINAGTATVTLTGMGSYSGTVSKTFTIAPVSVGGLQIALSQTEYVYDGTAKTPAVTVNDGTTVLAENTDYTIGYQDNNNVGTATMNVTGMGNYSGTTSANFVINPAALTSVTLAQTSFDYDLFYPVAQTADVDEVRAGGLIVPEGQYEVDGNTAIEPGDYAVTVTGTGNYTGSMSAYYVINDQVIDADAEKTESGEDLNDVKLTLSVVDRNNKTLAIDKFTGGASAGTEGITVVVPAEINGWSVAVISQGAMEGMGNVTDIYMPDTKATINVEQNALPASANIHTPLALLDDYALMASLKDNYETDRVMTAVKPVNKYWTLSSGVDVLLPEGVKAYIAKADGKDGVNILELPGHRGGALRAQRVVYPLQQRVPRAGADGQHHGAGMQGHPATHIREPGTQADGTHQR